MKGLAASCERRLPVSHHLLVIGSEKNGFVHVQGASGDGRVKVSLFNKQQ
jgi:hypothetical protein